MSLFNRGVSGAPQSAYEALSAVPDASTHDLARIDRLPTAAANGISDAAWAALNLALGGDFEAAEPDFRALMKSGSEVDAAFAMGELGVFLTELPEGSSGWIEGVSLLSQSLAAPFRDVVGTAAWNLAEVLTHTEDEALQRKGEGYAAMAVQLEEKTALVVSSERALGSGDQSDEIRRRLDRALELLDEGSVFWHRAKAAQTIFEIADQDEPVRSWFVEARAAIDPDMWQELLSFFLVQGMFNVEGGNASVSSRIFGDCNGACYFRSPYLGCGTCARTLTNFNEVAAGMGDGVYPALALLDRSDEPRCIGGIALFQDAFASLSRAGFAGNLAPILSRGAPMILGRIHSDGELYFSDSSTSYDSADLIVDVDVVPGEYVVVVWVTTPQSMDNTMRPLALGAFGEDLGRKLSEVVPLADPAQLIPGMWGKPDLMVHAHMMPVREAVAAENWEADREDNLPRGLSWIIQSAEAGGEDAADFLRGEPIDFNDELLEALARRGLRTLTASWWEPTGNPSTDELCSALAQTQQDVLSPGELRDLVRHPSAFVRRAVAARDDLSPEVLQLLAGDPDERVRWSIASKADASPQMLAALVDDPSVEVQAAVAANERTPAAFLEHLARDRRSPAAVAGNPSTPASALLHLVDDPAPATREAIASRSDMPAEVLIGFCSDPSPDVRRGLAGNYALPVEAQNILARDEGRWVRSALASNPSLSDNVAAVLAQDSDYIVRSTIADRENCPSAILEMLATDEEQYVRDSVFENEAATDEMRAAAALLGVTAQTPETDDDEGMSLHTAWDDTDDLYSSYARANELKDSGNLAAAMDVWEEDARRAGPWSLATFTWVALLEGDHARAAALYDDTFELCEEFTEECIELDQESELSGVAFTNLVNARSNDALNRLALGGPNSVAREIWEEMASTGHAESNLCPAVLDYREGRIDAARERVASATPEAIAEMRDIVLVGRDVRGWFAEWCQDIERVLDLADDAGPGREGSAVVNPMSAPAPASPSGGAARFCVYCGAERLSPEARFCGSCGQAF